jgi:CDP-6-deoxy-D-xylo-4-hexulose-3-dehydrase
MTNSGSSALDVAIQAMGWKPGTRVATPTLTFPTTISPIVKYGMIPVFVDADETYNANPFQLAELAESGVDYAVLPHMVGNTLNPAVWTMFKETIEDSCDALGSKFGPQLAGTFGTISCFSFYGAHHLFTGEGGMTCTKNTALYDKMLSIVSWGRDCLCRPAEDNVCGKRFDVKVDGVDYDHKYIASNFGGNYKPLDLCGVLGNIQINKLERFTEIRKRNFNYLYNYFQDIQDIVTLPKIVTGADPSWFAFPITLRKGNRKEITGRIEKRGVQTRLMFAGNITRHPCMKDVPHEKPFPLDVSDSVMANTFMVGLNQTVTPEECHKIATVVKEEVTK